MSVKVLRDDRGNREPNGNGVHREVESEGTEVLTSRMARTAEIASRGCKLDETLGILKYTEAAGINGSISGGLHEVSYTEHTYGCVGGGAR